MRIRWRADRFAARRRKISISRAQQRPSLASGCERGTARAGPPIYLALVHPSLLPPPSICILLFLPSTRTSVPPFRFISMTVGLNLNLCPRYYLWPSRAWKNFAYVISGNFAAYIVLSIPWSRRRDVEHQQDQTFNFFILKNVISSLRRKKSVRHLLQWRTEYIRDVWNMSLRDIWHGVK